MVDPKKSRSDSELLLGIDPLLRKPGDKGGSAKEATEV